MEDQNKAKKQPNLSISLGVSFEQSIEQISIIVKPKSHKINIKHPKCTCTALLATIYKPS